MKNSTCNTEVRENSVGLIGCLTKQLIPVFFNESKGRSSGEDTFHINMANMKLLEVNTNDTESPTGKSMRTGTGNSWIDIYIKK